MPETPHEYVVRTPKNEADHVELFHTIWREGVSEKFGSRNYRYWYPGDGWKYWAMTTELAKSRIINRARITADRLRDAMTDDDIAQAVASDPNAVPLDVDWSKARLVIPPSKAVVTTRLDSDLLDWFRDQGPGYQTRVNAVLRSYFDASPRRSRPHDPTPDPD